MPEIFRELDDVELLQDLFADSISPILDPQERHALRVYFAYSLSDAVRLKKPVISSMSAVISMRRESPLREHS